MAGASSKGVKSPHTCPLCGAELDRKQVDSVTAMILQGTHLSKCKGKPDKVQQLKNQQKAEKLARKHKSFKNKK